MTEKNIPTDVILKVTKIEEYLFNPKSSIELKILPVGLMKSLLVNDLSGLTLTIENHLLGA